MMEMAERADEAVEDWGDGLIARASLLEIPRTRFESKTSPTLKSNTELLQFILTTFG